MIRRFFSLIVLVSLSCIWAVTLSETGSWIDTAWKDTLSTLSSTNSSNTDRKTVSQPLSLQEQAHFKDDINPLLPSIIYATAGTPLTLYTDGLLLVQDVARYKIGFTIDNIPALVAPRSWQILPTSRDIGDHLLTIGISDWQDTLLASKTVTLRIIANEYIEQSELDYNLLIVGDSATHQSAYVNDLYEMLDTATSGALRFIGTHQPKPSFVFYEEPLPQVFHEGYGGWGWRRFLDHYQPDKASIYHAPRSPFVFFEAGKPTLNIERYILERQLTGQLDAVVFQLGINDTFGFDPSKKEVIEAQMDELFLDAKLLVAAFRDTSPQTQLFIMTPPYFTASPASFERQYGASGQAYADPWRHRKIVRAYTQALLKVFDDVQDYVTIIPSHAIMDLVDGYSSINPGHPNDLGNLQIAQIVYSTLRGVHWQITQGVKLE